MSAGLWLAARELRARRLRAVIALGAVAAATGLGVGLELLARGREEATALRVDAMGPSLRIVPSGADGGAVARLELDGMELPAETAALAEEGLGRDLRELRPRLVLTRDVSGRPTPVVGQGPGAPGGVMLGAALAERLRSPPTVRISGVEHVVAGVRPPAGSAEDAAAFLPLAPAQALAGHAAVNELQLFLRAGVHPTDAAARLAPAVHPARVLPAGRGAVADEEIHGSLARARRIAQGVLALMVALGLAVAAHLDAAERRVEVATLVAVGAPRRAVLAALLTRSTAIGLAGGLLGALAGAAVAAGTDGRSTRSSTRDPASASGTSCATGS